MKEQMTFTTPEQASTLAQEKTPPLKNTGEKNVEQAVTHFEEQIADIEAYVESLAQRAEQDIENWQARTSRMLEAENPRITQAYADRISAQFELTLRNACIALETRTDELLHEIRSGTLAEKDMPASLDSLVDEFETAMDALRTLTKHLDEKLDTM